MFKLPSLALPLLCLAASQLLAAEPSFTPLPELPGGSTVVRALSAEGSVAVGDSGGLPFRWTRESGIAAIGNLPGAAFDVSASGDVAVGYQVSVDGFPQAFRWSAGEVVSLPGLFNRQSRANGVSADGSVVVGELDGATYWGLGNFPDRRRPLAGNISSAVAASRDGSIIVGNSGDVGAMGAFLWENERPTFLGPIGHVLDLTPDGMAIVGLTVSGGFLRNSAGQVTSLDIFPTDISDDGRTITGSFGGGRPVLWTADTGAVELQPVLENLGLDLTGWTLTAVTAISGDGSTLAGHGIPPDPAMSGAWIATIPEPSTWVLGCLALAITTLRILSHRRTG